MLIGVVMIMRSKKCYKSILSESCCSVHMFESILDNIELYSSLHNNFIVILYFALFFVVCYVTDGCIHFLVIDDSSSAP